MRFQWQLLCLPLLSAVALLAPAAVPAHAGPAAGTVELELVGDTHGTAMTFQGWARALEAAGIRDVRMRTAEELGPPSIEVHGNTDRPIYVVTGIVRSASELDLPGRRFRRSELSQLAQWLKDIAANGPPEQREARSAFGLTASQFARVRKDLATPVGFSTKGMRRTEVFEKIAGQLKFPAQTRRRRAAGVRRRQGRRRVGRLERGTALACTLRAAGYLSGAAPGRGRNGLCGRRGPEGTRSVADRLGTREAGRYRCACIVRMHDINMQNVPVTKAIEAIGKRVKMPILLDHNAMERQGIEPDKTNVAMPRTRTSYSVALRHLLFQRRDKHDPSLKHEIRCDEAGTPLIWITSAKDK